MRYLVFCIVWGMLSAAVFGMAVSDVTVGGNFYGGFNVIKQGSSEDFSQFDYAGNVDIGFSLSEQVTGLIQFQGGPGDGIFGFAGPEAVVTDINLTYDSGRGYVVTAGSFDMPFGMFTERLTNNGDVSASPFFLNPLSYEALGGIVGTLNTVGIMGKTESYSRFFDVTGALTNGTSETAANPGGGLAVLVSVGKEDFFGTYDYAFTYMKSDYSFDDGYYIDLEDFDSVESGVSGFLAEFGSTDTLFGKTFESLSYAGVLTYDDADSSTEDQVFILGGDTVLNLDNGWVLGLRNSWWIPRDRNNSGDGISADVPVPGFSLTGERNRDVMLVRTQVSVTVPIEEGLSFSTELFYDRSDDAADAGGIISYISGSF